MGICWLEACRVQLSAPTAAGIDSPLRCGFSHACLTVEFHADWQPAGNTGTAALNEMPALTSCGRGGSPPLRRDSMGRDRESTDDGDGRAMNPWVQVLLRECVERGGGQVTERCGRDPLPMS